MSKQGKRYTPEEIAERQARMKELLRDGLGVRDICARLKIGKSTFYADRRAIRLAEDLQESEALFAEGAPSYEQALDAVLLSGYRIRERGKLEGSPRLEREGCELILRTLAEKRAGGEHRGIDMEALRALGGDESDVEPFEGLSVVGS